MLRRAGQYDCEIERPDGWWSNIEHWRLYSGGYEGRGGLHDGTLWDTSRFKFVRNFSHNYLDAVQNKLVSKFSKIACGTVAFATGSALVDGLVDRQILWV